MFNKKKDYTKSYKKAFKSIDDLIDIKEIYYDCILLKDKTIVKGIKVSPIDIWTCQNAYAEKVISALRYAFNQFNFPVYQAMVYSPSTFEELADSLVNELENASEVQQRIIIDDIEKLEEFSLNNKKIEFFCFIKHKDERILQRRYNQLTTELSRSFYVTDCAYLDYNKYLTWLFDLNDNFLSKAYFKGRTLLDESVTKEQIKEKIQDIDIEIINEEKNDLDIKYKLFEITNSEEYFTINGKYYSVIIAKALPKSFDVGILNYIGRNQNIKTFFITKDSELDLVKCIRKETKDLKDKLRSATIRSDKTREKELQTSISSLDQFASEMVRNKDKTLDLSLAMVVSHFEFKEMQYIKKKFTDELRRIGFTVLAPKKLQLALFKYFNPIFYHDYLISDTLEDNIGFPISTSSFALTYPYYFSTNEDLNGFLYGYEANMKGRILFNPWYYIDQEKESVFENRLTGNIILLGDTGSGKTTDLYLLFRYFIRRNNFIMWVDPENKNKKETLNKGGTYLEFGNKEHMFNLFQLIRVSVDDELNSEELRKRMWDSEMAIINAVDTFKNVLILYNKNIEDNTLAVVGTVAQKMYEKFGFLDSVDKNGVQIKAKYPTFDNLKNTDYPTLSDFADTLIEVKNLFESMNEIKFADACEDLFLKITPMLSEHRFLFDGHTTVDIELRQGNVLGIGTKRLYTMTENVRNALHYIIYSQAFNYCLDDKVNSAFIYDEAHTTMKTSNIITLLDQFTRRSRKYNNISLLGTQEPLDFGDETQQSILNQTTYIICKLLSKQNAQIKLQEMIGLDERDVKRISTFVRGDSYFICGNKSFFMHTLLTVKEEQQKGNNYA